MLPALMAGKGFSTRAIHTSLKNPEVPSRPVATPIYQSASFEFEKAAGMADTLAHPEAGFMYSRVSNPTVDVLERTLADLEEASSAVAFASGMAAVHASAYALVKSGDHVIAPKAFYGNSYSLFRSLFAKLGVEASFVDIADLAAVRDAVRPSTRMIYAETIANPTLVVSDIPALGEIAKKAGARLVIDSTFATPYLCRPVTLGADLVLHSLSKYLGGHGDVIGGIVAGNPDVMGLVKRVAIDVGGILEPFTAWLVIRGMKTLSLRMERHSSNAKAIAERLATHAKVKGVVYPGLPSHPQHAIAKRMLKTGGGMVSFELAGGREAGVRFLEKLKVFLRAASLGDAHSLALVPSATSHRQFDAKQLAEAGISEGFVRLSAGLEEPEDLLADLEAALA